MHHDSTRIPARAALALSLACLTAAAAACGPDPIPCDPCPEIGGEYQVESSSVLGSCEFQPVTLGSTITLEQTTDTTGLSTSIEDSINEDQIDLTGEIYSPTEKDPVEVIANFSLTAQVVRPATALGTDLVSLFITMSGQVTESAGLREVSGALTSQNATTGTSERCRVSVTFNASDVAGTTE